MACRTSPEIARATALHVVLRAVGQVAAEAMAGRTASLRSGRARRRGRSRPDFPPRASPALHRLHVGDEGLLVLALHAGAAEPLHGGDEVRAHVVRVAVPAEGRRAGETAGGSASDGGRSETTTTRARRPGHRVTARARAPVARDAAVARGVEELPLPFAIFSSSVVSNVTDESANGFFAAVAIVVSECANWDHRRRGRSRRPPRWRSGRRDGPLRDGDVRVERVGVVELDRLASPRHVT